MALKQKTADKIRRLVEDNYHIEAHAAVAEVAFFHAATRAFTALATLRDEDNEMHTDVAQVFDRWRARLKKYIEDGNGGDNAREAYACL